MAIWTIIPAAGVGSRMQANRPKQYLDLLGQTVIEHTLGIFLGHEQISGVIVAISPEDSYWHELSISHQPRLAMVDGGSERCHSVLNALTYLENQSIDPDDWVLVHDAARPCLRREDLDHLINEVTMAAQGGILAVPVRDTMKQGDDDGRHITRTIDRSHLWHALTPQMFRLGELRQAIEAALNDGFAVTDEASALEHAGQQPLLVRGHADNIKITIPEDLALAEFYLRRRTWV
jgi:2-C-methyl-D-erythritol 4-phosphate cytidylyltransferase